MYVRVYVYVQVCCMCVYVNMYARACVSARACSAHQSVYVYVCSAYIDGAYSVYTCVCTR